MSRGIAVFFDIGSTLAEPLVTDGHLSGLEVYPFVPEVLERLRHIGDNSFPVAIGLMSNTGDETATALDHVLTDSGLAAAVDSGLCLFSSVEGVDKAQPAFFQRGVQRTGLPPARCVFVGEDAAERAVADSVGLRVSFHPLHAVHLVDTMRRQLRHP